MNISNPEIALIVLGRALMKFQDIKDESEMISTINFLIESGMITKETVFGNSGETHIKQPTHEERAIELLRQILSHGKTPELSSVIYKLLAEIDGGEK